MPLFNFPWLTKRNCLRWVDCKPIGVYWSLPSLLNPSRTSVMLRGRQMVLWFWGHLGRSRTPYQIHLQSGYNIKLPPPLIIHKVLVSFSERWKPQKHQATHTHTHSFHEVTASWTDEFHITHCVAQKHERHSGFLWLWVVLFQSWARQWITDGWVRTLILCGARSEEYPRAQRWALKSQIGEHGERRRRK